MRSLNRNATRILCVLVISAFAWGGWGVATSVLLGGLAALINHAWMSTVVGRALEGGEEVPAVGVMAKYLLRLVLILGILFAMIRFSFLSLGGAVLGLSILVLAGMLEAFLLLVGQLKASR